MHVLRLLLWLLPPSRLKNRLLSLTPGWRVDPTCHLSPNIVWRVHNATIGPMVRVGAGNAFRELWILRIDERAEIGQFNWFSAAARYIPRSLDDTLRGQLWLEPYATVASRHYLDASGGIVLEQYSVLGGVRSTLLSHSLDVRRDDLAIATIRIGQRSVVFTNCTLLPGAVVGPQIAVGANSVVSGVLDQPETLYAGSPARPARDLPGAKFFQRTGARVMPREEEELMRERLRTSEKRR